MLVTFSNFAVPNIHSKKPLRQARLEREGAAREREEKEQKKAEAPYGKLSVSEGTLFPHKSPVPLQVVLAPIPWLLHS